MTKQNILTILILICLATTITWAQKKNPPKKLKPRPTPVLQLENGELISKRPDVVRNSPQTVCLGDKISFQAKVAGIEPTEQIKVKWTASARKKGELVSLEKTTFTEESGRILIDTGMLQEGTYVVTAETMAAFKDCDGGCTAYDSKTFVVSSCELQPVCFTSPTVELTSATKSINPGETVSICSTAVTGGYKFGPLISTWTTTAGKIRGDLSCAKLDTTGITAGTNVTVHLRLKAANFENCEAEGSLSFKVAEAKILVELELTSCDSFKVESARVDNVCKAILYDAARQLENDPQARLVIDSYHRPGERAVLAYERGKNVRDRLADGSIGVRIDANRLIVRPSGQSFDGKLVRLYVLPTGAQMPGGAKAVDVGGVTREARRTPVPRRR